jgi:hypothetical protein
MAYSNTLGQSDLMTKLLAEKKAARELKERRYLEWNQNYELYRNKVKTNRLTQRQEVNIPLMKETIKTLLSRVDDAPTVDWKELSGDSMKELYFQEWWNHDYERLNLEGIDVQDKKTVLLYGRSFKKLNWLDNGFSCQSLDIYDTLIDPLTDPLDIESARYIIHQNIFRSLRDILADDRYSTEGKNKLKIHLMSPEGIVQQGKDKEEWEKKMDRLKSLGVSSGDFDLFAGGDVMVNLCEHYTNIWDTKKKAFERRVIVYANDTIELLNESLEDLLGVNFWPFVSWAEDIETQDIWSDSVADLVRVPNQVVNIWFSQLVENRTLRNFQMHWYDATQEGYTPQTYEPGPGRMLPAPGDPNKTILPVNIQGLDETLTAIQFVTTLVERGTGATSIEKGQAEKRQATLGEIEILVGKAQERAIAMTKMYRRAWFEFANKYYELNAANASEKRTLYKTSRGVVYPKTVFPADWKSEQGFKPIVASTSEQEEESTKGLQKFQFILQQFPENQVLKRISQKRMLETLDLTPEELKEVEEAQKQAEVLAQQQSQLQAQPAEGGAPQGGIPSQVNAQPAQPAIA